MKLALVICTAAALVAVGSAVPSVAHADPVCTIDFTGTDSIWTDIASWANPDGTPANRVPAATDVVCESTNARPGASIAASGNPVVAGIYMPVIGTFYVYDTTLTIGSAAGSSASIINDLRVGAGAFGGPRNAVTTIDGTADLELTGPSVGLGADPTYPVVLGSTGVVTLAAGASATLETVTLAAGTTLINRGTIDQQMSMYSSFTLGADAVLDNAGALTFEGDHRAGIVGDSTARVINDAGATIAAKNFGAPPYEIAPSFDNAGTVEVDRGMVQLDDPLNLSGGVLSGGTWVVGSGIYGNPARAVLRVPSAITTNAATLQINAYGQMETTDDQSAISRLAINSGTLVIARKLSLPPLTNSGVLEVYRGGNYAVDSPTMRGYTQIGGMTVLHNCYLRIGATGAGVAKFQGGELTGTGVIVGSVQNVSGNVHPGDETELYTGDSLYVTGNYLQGPSGTLSIEVLKDQYGGDVVGGLHVTGTAHLGGTVDFDTSGVDAPTQFPGPIVTAPYVGRFTHETGQIRPDGNAYDVHYRSDGVDVDLVPAQRISITDRAMAEGDSGTTPMPVPVRLDGPSTSTITVDYATSDLSATAGSDYLATSGTLTFPPGSTEQDISVPVVGDTAVEGDESYRITLSNPSLAVIADGIGTETILDDDPAGSAPVVSSVSPGALGQGATRTVTVTGANFDADAHVAFGASDVVATSVTVDSSTTMQVTVAASSDAVVGARDVRVKNPGKGDGVCTECLVVTASPAPVAASAPLGVGAVSREVTLSGSAFQPGAVVSSGSGISVSTSFVSSNALSLSVTVARTVPAGTYDLTVVNPDGGSATCAGCLTIRKPPRIVAMSPDTAARDTDTTVTFTGSGFVAGATVTGPPGVTFDAVVVGSGTALTATMHVAATAEPGSALAVTITNPAAGGYGVWTKPVLTIT